MQPPWTVNKKCSKWSITWDGITISIFHTKRGWQMRCKGLDICEPIPIRKDADPVNAQKEAIATILRRLHRIESIVMYMRG